MVDNNKVNQIRENLRLEEKAFIGETPAGKYSVIKVAEEPVPVGSDGIWYPVDCKLQGTDEIFQFSLKGLLSAKGIQYSTRDTNERIKAWFALEGQTSKKFEYLGKETKIVKLKNKDSLTIDGKTYHKGEEMPLKMYSFKSFKVG